MTTDTAIHAIEFERKAHDFAWRLVTELQYCLLTY